MKNKTYGLIVLFLLSTTGVPACSFLTSNTAVAVNVNEEPNANASPAATPASAGAESQSAAAEALVADLYKQHNAKKSPFFQTKNRGLVDKYFTKRLADLVWKDANESSGEVGAIDGDPLYNAQDVEIKNFAIGRADVKGETADVPVTFTNFGEKQTLNFALRKAGNSWKIDDIKFSADDSLMKWLTSTHSADTKPAAGADGDFEGRYKIGPTTCTVKPIKMAFEVRWAKGSGVETFYFKDGTTFESEGEPDGPNSFVFDDANYNSGTFYRSDGKEFRVTRGG